MRLVLLALFTFTVFSCKDNKEQKPISEPSAMEEVEQTVKPQLNDVDLSVVMGKFEPSEHPSFVLIDKSFADREGLYLQKETYNAFQKMSKAAAKHGVKLTIRSATRNFEYQRGIWERKWAANQESQHEIDAKTNALKILEYSSMPSTSRHHWGTDIDLNSFENSWFESGEGLKLYNWMIDNARDYGFCQVYTTKDDSRPEGYNEEKWHWSYLPIADKYFHMAEDHVKDEMIAGFKGAEVAKNIGVVQKYILGIDKSCK